MYSHLLYLELYKGWCHIQMKRGGQKREPVVENREIYGCGIRDKGRVWYTLYNVIVFCVGLNTVTVVSHYGKKEESVIFTP